MTGGLDLTRRGNARDNVLEKYAQAMAAQNIPCVSFKNIKENEKMFPNSRQFQNRLQSKMLGEWTSNLIFLFPS